MGARDEGGVVGVAPCLGVEVQAEDEVGLNGFIDELGAGADLGGAIEEALGEFAEGGGIVGGALGSEGGKVFRAQRGDRFGGAADEGDGGSEVLEKRLEQFRDVKGHVAFGDRLFLTDLEPALLDLRPLAADVAGVDGDVEVRQRFPLGRDGEGGGILPQARGGEGVFRGGKVEDKGRLGGIGVGDDLGLLVADHDELAPGVVGGENFREEFLEIVAGNGALVFF